MSSLPFSAFTADGFRGLRSLEVSELRGINVFVGGNNSGKTSVLEALSLLANPTRGEEWVNLIQRRDYGRLDESVLMSLRWCFAGAELLPIEQGEVPTACRFEVSGSHALRSMTSTYREHIELFDVDRPRHDPGAHRPKRPPNEQPTRHCTIESSLTWSEDDTFSADHDHPPMATPLVANELYVVSRSSVGRGGVVQRSRSGPNYAALLPYSYQLNTLQVGSHSELLFAEDDDSLIQLIREFDPEVQRVQVASFLGRRPAIYVKHRRLGVVPLSVFGDAMRRCLLLATTLTSLGRGGVLLLDEIEGGIHIDSLSKVFKWLAGAARQVGVQVFATTHSLEVLDALLAAEVGEEDLAAYQIKQGNERTECRHFPFDSLKRLRYERGLDIR